MTAPAQTLEISDWEALLFFGIASIMVILAVYGLLITRRAVYSAACVIANMVCLAFLYTMLEAPFMGVVQVAVYTGAILMMFLFVLMMIGVDSSDTTHETLPLQRPVAILGGLGFIVIVGGAVLGAVTPDAVGMEAANQPTNPQAIAETIFGSYVLAMELTGALLIIAAVGAMTLTHRERTRKKYTQPELVDAKMEAYAQLGRHIGQKPPTGVFAESNSAANPPLTVGGKELVEAVPRVLRVRGQARRLSEISPTTAARVAAGEFATVKSKVAQAGLPGMPGEEAPVYPDAAPLAQLNSTNEPDAIEPAKGEEESK